MGCWPPDTNKALIEFYIHYLDLKIYFTPEFILNKLITDIECYSFIDLIENL